MSVAHSGALRTGAVPNTRRMPFMVVATSSVAVGDPWPAVLCMTEIDVLRRSSVATARVPARSDR
jgi:hypothetical protein